MRMTRGNPQTIPGTALDVAAATRLWQKSEHLTGSSFAVNT